MILPDKFDALVVTPSDTATLVRPAQGTVAQTNANPNFIGTGQTGSPSAEVNCATAISVGVAGNVVIVDWLGNTQTLALGVGFMYFLRFKQVKSTSTTATGIIAYFPVFG